MTEQSTLIVADTHVHVYPCYNLARFFEAASTNLERIVQLQQGRAVEAAARATRAVGVLFLTERFDCHYFQDLRDGLPSAVPHGWTVSVLSEKVVQMRSNSSVLLIVSGFQVITLERLEVLTLNSVNRIPDGLPLTEVLAQVRRPEIPVLNWSLGKWMFRRGETIEEVLRTNTNQELVVGDIRARPLGWGQPRLLTLAADRGMPLIAGSDPLPVVGEEQFVFSYASTLRIEGPADEARIGDLVHSLLETRSSPPKIVGNRGGPVETFLRLRKNSVSKKG